MTGKWIEEIPEEIPHLLVCDGDEWSALYVDGKLDKVGDTYTIDERIRELADVVTLQTMDFLQGGNTRSDVAHTIWDLQNYRHRISEQRAAVERLRHEAQELLNRASRLEAGQP